jgi:hypothetical protein
LRQAAANNGIVAVEPQRLGLAVEYFFADVLIDQPLQLLRCRWPLPLLLPLFL